MAVVVAGSQDAILMVECGANGVTEAEVLDALDIAHSEIKTLIGAMEELPSKARKEKVEVEAPQIDDALVERIKSEFGDKLVAAIATEGKLERYEALEAVGAEGDAATGPDTG